MSNSAPSVPAARRDVRPRRRRAPARAAPPRGGRRGAPLPVRRARRAAHRAPAARRHALPDDVLRHVPPPHRRGEHPRDGGRHEGDDRAAGRRRGARRGLREAHERLPARAVPSSATCPRSTGSPPGGMPTRVKCLHVLVGHSLAAGPGVNPLGDEALAMLDEWWQPTSCAAVHAAEDAAAAGPPEDGTHGEPDGTETLRVGAIDCGTNSIRLLVADVDPGDRGAHRRPSPHGDRPARPRASTAPASSPPSPWSARCAVTARVCRRVP